MVFHLEMTDTFIYLKKKKCIYLFKKYIYFLSKLFESPKSIYYVQYSLWVLRFRLFVSCYTDNLLILICIIYLFSFLFVFSLSLYMFYILDSLLVVVFPRFLVKIKNKCCRFSLREKHQLLKSVLYCPC